ncbi:hypothetical protein ACISK3_05395 [Morganella morganii]
MNKHSKNANKNDVSMEKKEDAVVLLLLCSSVVLLILAGIKMLITSGA